ncbi:hypothetical protein [Luteibacter sp. 9135]|uniref:hypothetical protein n=1 Tax=Luteibacter sp. 9135 TaxID=1500893 RepID=UPI00163B1A0B|nr:hypothetical protein [Luteibacter sp. 9135]
MRVCDLLRAEGFTASITLPHDGCQTAGLEGLTADQHGRIRASRTRRIRHPRHGLGNKSLFGFGGWEKAARKDHGAALDQKHPVFAGLKEIRDATPMGGHLQVAQIID